MPETPDPDPSVDSLDIVERVMAIEQALPDSHLSPEQRERLIREIGMYLKEGDIGNGSDDDDFLSSLVRNLEPRRPKGQAGAAVKPEEG